MIVVVAQTVVGSVAGAVRHRVAGRLRVRPAITAAAAPPPLSSLPPPPLRPVALAIVQLAAPGAARRGRAGNGAHSSHHRVRRCRAYITSAT